MQSRNKLNVVVCETVVYIMQGNIYENTPNSTIMKSIAQLWYLFLVANLTISGIN